MFYKIIDIRTDVQTQALYVLVHFWDRNIDFLNGHTPILINDFYMNVTNTITKNERDANDNLITVSGKVVSDKTFEDPLDPFRKIVETVDVPKFMNDTIDRFVARAKEKKFVGDRTSDRKLTDADPRKIIEKVIHLRGLEKTK